MSYYPFGLQLCDGTTDSNVQSHRYNGKELDKMHGLNTYDYGARQYNPVTARWDRMDPLAEKYYSISPYAYCANNPVRYVDLDGKEIVIRNKKEEFNYSKGGEYKGDNKFITEVLCLINQLAENGGEEIVNNLSTSKFLFTIEKPKGGERNGFMADGTPLQQSGNLILWNESSDKFGCGGRIAVDLNQTVFVPVRNKIGEIVKDNKPEPMFIILGHEFKHADNARRGMVDNNKVDENHPDPAFQNITKDEKSAVLFENSLRRIAGLRQRAAYTFYEDQPFYIFDE